MRLNCWSVSELLCLNNFCKFGRVDWWLFSPDHNGQYEKKNATNSPLVNDTSCHQRTDATYRWAYKCIIEAWAWPWTLLNRLTMIVKHVAIKQDKQLKPFWFGGEWLKYQYGEVWQIDCITPAQTCQSECLVLTMAEATARWLETCRVSQATTQNTIWVLKDKSYSDMALHKELSQARGLISKTTS